jgi:hypothetical protein
MNDTTLDVNGGSPVSVTPARVIRAMMPMSGLSATKLLISHGFGTI